MRRPLLNPRRRVESLERDFAANCTDTHSRCRVEEFIGDAELSTWPEPDDPRRCDCGRTITYVRLVCHLDPPLAEGIH